MVALIGAACALQAGQASAALRQPVNGKTYVIRPELGYADVPLRWSYTPPEGCVDGTVSVYFHETPPTGPPGINGGGDQHGPFDPAAAFEQTVPGTYEGYTSLSCVIDAPPIGHPSGDYVLHPRLMLDRVEYLVQETGVGPEPDLKPLSPAPQESYESALLRFLCVPTNHECLAKARAIVEVAKKALRPRHPRRAKSKWVEAGQAPFTVEGPSRGTVDVPLERAARTALKKRKTLRVRITIRASVEGGPTETTRKKTKLELAT